MATALSAVLVALGAVLVAVASQWRNPALVGHWPLPEIGFVALDTAAAVAAAILVRRARLLGLCALALPLAAAVVAAGLAYRAQALRAVLELPPGKLRPAAAHVIAGFYDMDEARALARAGVAGLFLSQRNVPRSDG